MNNSLLPRKNDWATLPVSPCVQEPQNIRMPEIRAVTFDVGGTLIQPWPSVGHVYAAVAAEHGCAGLDPAALNQRFAAAWNSRGEFEHSPQAWAGLVDATFAGLVDRRPSESFFPELYERFGDPSAWRIHADVLPTLDELASRGFRLAAVSNWDERLRPLLKALNLDGYFEAVLVSCELYFAKPSGVVFEHALRRLGVTPAETLHVGDSQTEDVEGARSAGLRAVLIARSDPPGEGRIQALTDLLTILPGRW